MNESGSPFARIRFLNCWFRNAKISIYLNKQKIADSIHYKDLTEYILIMPGVYLLEVYVTGPTRKLLVTETIRLQENFYYTAFIQYTSDQKFKVSKVTDEPFVPSDETKLRVIHLSLADSVFDVAVKGRDVVFDNVYNGCRTSYLGLSPMTIDLEVRTYGTKNIVAKLPQLKFNANVIYTLLILNGPQIEVFLLEDC